MSAVSFVSLSTLPAGDALALKRGWGFFQWGCGSKIDAAIKDNRKLANIDDVAIVRMFVEKDPCWLFYANDRAAGKIVDRDPPLLRYANKGLQAKIVGIDCLYLKYASEDLQTDEKLLSKHRDAVGRCMIGAIAPNREEAGSYEERTKWKVLKMEKVACKALYNDAAFFIGLIERKEDYMNAYPCEKFRVMGHAESKAMEGLINKYGREPDFKKEAMSLLQWKPWLAQKWGFGVCNQLREL